MPIVPLRRVLGPSLAVGVAIAALTANLAWAQAPGTMLADTTTTSTSTTTSATTTSTATTSTTSTATTTSTTTSTSTTSTTTSTSSAPTVAHDGRYYGQTGFRIDNDTIWDYFNRRGGVPTFGYPSSRTFTLQGFTVQFFQRRIVQLDQQGHARLLNLLDPGLLPYTAFNGSTFPGVDAALVASSPNPTDQPAVLAWVRANAPDTFDGRPVDFYQTFAASVSAHVAFPNGGDPSLLPGLDLELWGVPTSAPLVDPNNHNFIYQRWQRGIMHYDAGCNCTQGILLADYLKDVLTGRDLPSDLAQEAANSPFLNQYAPGKPNWLANPSLLPATNLTYAFEQG